MLSLTPSTLLILCVVGSVLLASSGKHHMHTVTFNDNPVWTVGLGVAYADMSIKVGDTLSFVSFSAHDVVLLHPKNTSAAWSQCGQNGVSGNTTTVFASSAYPKFPMTAKHYTPPSCGDFYIVCSISAHCMYGQRIKVTVKNADNTPCSTPCKGAACVTAASKVPKTAAYSSGVIHAVKPKANSEFWGQGPYSAMTVDIGDHVVFRTGAGFHDVATVTKAAFVSCNMTQKTVVADWTYGTTQSSASCKGLAACCSGSTCGVSGNYVTYTFNASVAGDTYFVCSIGNHCSQGQKIRVTVRPKLTSSSWSPTLLVSLFSLSVLVM